MGSNRAFLKMGNRKACFDREERRSAENRFIYPQPSRQPRSLECFCIVSTSNRLANID
jgi:hypothetical protein